MSKILTRTYDLEFEVRDGRTLVGLAVPYGQETQIGSYREQFALGAFAGVDAASVPLTAQHPRDGSQLPIGVSTSLQELPTGLHGSWRVSATVAGDEVLALAADKVPLALSIGFVPGDHDEWNRDRTRVIRRSASLDHIAVVRQGAYAAAMVSGVRESRGLGYAAMLARLRAH